MDRTKLKATVRHVISLLARKSYVELEQLSAGVRLSTRELREVIDEYDPCTVVMLPEEELDNLEFIEIAGGTRKVWAVAVDLWTQEEGRSDLTLEMTLIDSEQPLYGVELDNLHVL